MRKSPVISVSKVIGFGRRNKKCTCIITDHIPRIFPVSPGMPLYCTNAPGHVRYLKPIFILSTAGLNVSDMHVKFWDEVTVPLGGVIVDVLRCRLSITMPMMTSNENQNWLVFRRPESELSRLRRATMVQILIMAKYDSYWPYFPRKFMAAAATSWRRARYFQ